MVLDLGGFIRLLTLSFGYVYLGVDLTFIIKDLIMAAVYFFTSKFEMPKIKNYYIGHLTK